MPEAAPSAASSSASATAALNGETAPATASAGLPRGQKRARDSSATPAAAPPPSAHAPQSSAPRRIESVVFGGYEITTSFSSPYPFEDAISGGGGAAGAGEKRTLVRENTGRFGSQPAADGKTKKAGTAFGRRKSALAPIKSITPELVAPPPLVTAPVVKKEETSVAVAGSSNGHVNMAVDIIEDSEAGSPETAAGQDTAVSFGTDGEDALVASSLLPHIQRAAPPVPAISPLPPASADPAAASAESPSQLTPLTPGAVTVEPPAAPTTTTFDPHAPLARGQGGRFKPKPFGETVRGRRQLEKAAKAAAAALTPAPPAPGVDLPPPTKHLTVRERREIKKRAREEQEREAAANGEGQGHMTTKRLFVCEGCFKYMLEPTALSKHQKECQYKRPPGKKVYQRGAHTIYEVDGAVEKLYCQNLCLFGKLFIEHKYMFFDVEGFIFYIITDATPSRDWPLAYFSKEKVSYDDYNLACIVTFPQYRQKGWATLLIEFSYEITRRTASTPGTPERPLSALGMRGYLAYWTGVLVRYFRAVFQHFGDPPPLPTIAASSALAVAASPEHDRRKGRRSRSGWDGELPSTGTGLTVSLKRDAGGQASAALVPSSSRSSSRKRFNGDEAHFVFPTTLTDIAAATNIKPDDAAFALVESGLAQWRRPVIGEEGEEEEAGEKVLELIISRELVEQVAKEKGVRESPMLDLAYVLL